MKKQQQASRSSTAFAAIFHVLLVITTCEAWSASSFLGNSVRHHIFAPSQETPQRAVRSYISMRKQKASDKRTSRRQREGPQLLEAPPITITASPMQGNAWGQKVISIERPTDPDSSTPTGGRQRSRKRSNLYNRMARYHNTFLNALTLEYKAEVRTVIRCAIQFTIYRH